MNISLILSKKYPQLEWSMNADDYEQLEVYNGEKPSIVELESKWIEVQNEVNIISQIKQLESTITLRRQREAILGIDNGWLANIEAQIQSLRQQLQ